MSVTTDKGCTVITGRSIDRLRLLVAIQGLEAWSKHGMKITRMFSPKLGMQIVSEHTGRKYKRNDSVVAAREGREFLASHGI
jgi:hypothetical protein